MCAEAYNPDDDEDDELEPRVVHPKTDEQRCSLQDACRDILLFKTLDQVKKALFSMNKNIIYKYVCFYIFVCACKSHSRHTQEQFSEVLDGMFEVRVISQEHIIDQGSDGDNFYVIERCVLV